MSGLRFAVAFMVLGLCVGGCARPVEERAVASALAYQRVDTGAATAGIATPAVQAVAEVAPGPRVVPVPVRAAPAGPLAGRTLSVASAGEIALRAGEVILTFDDGPRSGSTEAILDALDRFGVSATFMMLGSAAVRHPELVREVALRGHTIGTHTYDHPNLAEMGNGAAMAEIARGEAAVARALAPIGHAPSPFFRFPYLAQTGVLRASVVASEHIVLDVHVDSKDYYKDSPETVLERTLARLEARGSGIVLFHDIQPRTVALLPDFLARLEARGFSVVRLTARTAGGADIVTAAAGTGAAVY